MITIYNCYKQIVAPENIWRAWLEYRKGKRSRTEVRVFERRLEENLLQLIDDLQRGAYRHGPYQKFLVHDPKKRVISAPSIRDHIVHQAIYNVLYPFFDRVFLPSSFSCRTDKGTHLAVKVLSAYLRQQSLNYARDCWILHGDIKKCFNSIEHETLFRLLTARIYCDRTLTLLREIGNSYSTNTGFGESLRGIPLGNLTSQLFINIYMHELDVFVKEKLRVKKYLRYADDFILVFERAEECQKTALLTREFIEKSLRLSFPTTHEHITNLARGFEVLGQRFLPFYRVIKPRTFRRSRHKFKLRCQQFAKSECDVNALNASWQSVKGMLKYGNNRQRENDLLNMANIVCN